MALERQNPVLTGERLTLRSLRRDDLPRLCAFNNDLETELAGGGDPPMPQSLDRLEADYNREVASGGRDGSTFAIEAEGKLIGQCALFNFDHTGHTCELGIAIGDAAYRGRGYGRETIILLLDYAFRLRNFRRVWLRVHGKNERAIRAYRACGFQEEGRQRAHVWSSGAYDDLVLMGILREEWDAAQAK